MRYLFALITIVAALAAVPAYGAGPAGVRLITDTLGGNGHARQGQGYRFVTDTLAPGGDAALQPDASARGHSFSWTDAGVGAAAAAGTLLALLGVTLIVTRQHTRLAV